MPDTAERVADLAESMLRAKSEVWALEATLSRTPRWRLRRRAELRQGLERGRRREQQALYFLGADVDWRFEYWPSP